MENNRADMGQSNKDDEVRATLNVNGEDLTLDTWETPRMVQLAIKRSMAATGPFSEGGGRPTLNL